MSFNDSNNMDIGIVLLPNKECKAFANSMTVNVAAKPPSLTKLPNNPHITMIHIANHNPCNSLYKVTFCKQENNVDWVLLMIIKELILEVRFH